MLQALLDAKEAAFADYDWFVVPVRFSRDLSETGAFRARKMLHLVHLIAHIVWIRLRHRPNIFYYTPAGPTRLPILRDIALLCIVRRLFAITVFHFHAGGVSQAYHRLPRILRPLFRFAYWDADLGIKVSPSAPDDPQQLRARRTAIVPNGVPDIAEGQMAEGNHTPPRILFVGLLSESKGVFVLLEALRLLRSRGVSAQCHFMGTFESDRVRAEFQRRVEASALTADIALRGVLTGQAKREAYATSDILCIPTFFESESFGLVAVEAMAFGLPVVATRWRGLADIVVNGKTGLLVPPREPAALADALAQLVRCPDEAHAMGLRGRARYERRFLLADHIRHMRDALELVASPPLDPAS